ncbi:MAG: J domain-containing protein [Ilumatobacteraceae bacterium]
MSDDPFAVLGVSADASPAEIAVARRRLAQATHPDHGGDVGGMQALNLAYDEALRRQRAEQSAILPPPAAHIQQRPRSSQRVQHDSPSFVIDAAPALAHEALFVVASSIGEVVTSAAPHIIECLLDEPIRCWCRLEVLAEGASSSISLIVERYDEELAPDIDVVRDEWVRNLNQLGQP